MAGELLEKFYQSACERINENSEEISEHNQFILNIFYYGVYVITNYEYYLDKHALPASVLVSIILWFS